MSLTFSYSVRTKHVELHSVIQLACYLNVIQIQANILPILRPSYFFLYREEEFCSNHLSSIGSDQFWVKQQTKKLREGRSDTVTVTIEL
jgi:hypothetical protein